MMSAMLDWEELHEIAGGDNFPAHLNSYPKTIKLESGLVITDAQMTAALQLKDEQDRAIMGQVGFKNYSAARSGPLQCLYAQCDEPCVGGSNHCEWHLQVALGKVDKYIEPWWLRLLRWIAKRIEA